jgi:cation diffusion facilitator family transporter
MLTRAGSIGRAPAMSSRNSHRPDTLRSILYALGANVAITIVKFAGALFSGSSALLAESVHSLADTGNEALLLVGRKQAKTPASAHHPLGHGRATYFWSFIVTLLLFTVGGVFSVWQGIRKLAEHSGVDSPWTAVAIVLLAMVAEGVSLRMALIQIAKVRAGRSLWRWFRETRHSELIVVLGEDLTAVIGLCLALAALVLTMVTDNPVYDAGGSIAIGALLVVVASGLAIEIKSLLIGESASPKTRRNIRRFIAARPTVMEVASLVTLQQGEELFVAIRARMDSTLSGRDLMKAIAETRDALQEAFPQATWVFLEPMPEADPRSDGRGGGARVHTKASRTRAPKRDAVA